MKIIANQPRKVEIENRLKELLATGKKRNGFFFNIGHQDYVFEGSWEDFGKLVKSEFQFTPIKLNGCTFNDPLLNRQFSTYVYSMDNKKPLPIGSIDITARVIYEQEVAEEIEALQNEYQKLITENGVLN